MIGHAARAIVAGRTANLSLSPMSLRPFVWWSAQVVALIGTCSVWNSYRDTDMWPLLKGPVHVFEPVYVPRIWVMNSLISNVPFAVAVQFAIIMAPDGIDIVKVAVGPLMVPDTLIVP